MNTISESDLEHMKLTGTACGQYGFCVEIAAGALGRGIKNTKPEEEIHDNHGRNQRKAVPAAG